ncbi:hypothetical protein EDB92DRAFT_1819414 [Lactarius akahatsu]|uniref:Uncharacterized protein n=1 Tax=Lactarius akahatsu TaxID=416441 RepID=A0AAD4LBS9_9AGAM|nr:hypothetical protein EDB92DRAFT_1819414 [Lactarius akahatsu]
MPLLLPSPFDVTSSEPAPRQRDRYRDHGPLVIISIDTFSSSSRPPRRSPRKTKKQRGQGQLMAYVLQRSRTRQRQTAAKGKARPRDNSGLKELVHVCKLRFGTTGLVPEADEEGGKRDGGCGDYEDDEEGEKGESKSKTLTPLDQALAAAFTHNSMGPNVMASLSVLAATCGSTRMRRLCRRAERGNPIRTLRPRRKRRRMADEHEQDDSDDSRIVDVSRELRPHVHARVVPAPQEQSSPVMSPDFSSLAGLLLTILPNPARTETANPPCALSHLHSSPDPRSRAQIAINSMRSGRVFAIGGAAIGRTVSSQLLPLPNLPPSPTAALVSPPPTLPPQLQPIPIICGMRVWISTSTSLWTSRPGPQMQTRMRMGSKTSSSLAPRRHFCAPRVSMLGFVIPEHGGVDDSPGADVDVGRALTSQSQGLSFNLASPDLGGEGWTDWRAGNVSVVQVPVQTEAPASTSETTRARRFSGVKPSGVTDEDDEEEKEEDIMGMLFENTSDNDFVLPLGLGKGRRSCAPVGADVLPSMQAQDSEDTPAQNALTTHIFLTLLERKYPQLTFDRKTSSVRLVAIIKRGETYVSKRDGWWRSWIARQDGSHCAAPIPAKKSKNKDRGVAQVPATTKQRAATMTTTTADAPVFDGSRSATAVFTVSGEPLGTAFFHGNNARIVSVSQPTAFPTAATTTHTTPTTITACPILEPAQKQQQLQRHQHVFIGKSRKTWGQLVSLLDPSRSRKRRKGKRRRRGSSSLNPLDDDDDDDEDGNLDEGGDADADADADDRIWPEERRGSLRRRWSALSAPRLALAPRHRSGRRRYGKKQRVDSRW